MPEDRWRCPACGGTKNRLSRSACRNCGSARPAAQCSPLAAAQIQGAEQAGPQAGVHTVSGALQPPPQPLALVSVRPSSFREGVEFENIKAAIHAEEEAPRQEAAVKDEEEPQSNPIFKLLADLKRRLRQAGAEAADLVAAAVARRKAWQGYPEAGEEEADDTEPDEGDTEEPQAGTWRPFEEALEFAQSLGLAGRKEWREWCKSGLRPADIPSHPDRVYAGQGWQGWKHWLGNTRNKCKCCGAVGFTMSTCGRGEHICLVGKHGLGLGYPPPQKPHKPTGKPRKRTKPKTGKPPTMIFPQTTGKGKKEFCSYCTKRWAKCNGCDGKGNRVSRSHTYLKGGNMYYLPRSDGTWETHSYFVLFKHMWSRLHNKKHQGGLHGFPPMNGNPPGGIRQLILEAWEESWMNPL